MTRMIGIGLMVGLAATVGGSVVAAQTAGDAQRLVDAVKVQDVEAVQALVKAGTDVNLRQGDGTAALHWAAHRDDAAVADLLIRAGATPNLADDHGVTPLSLACLNGSATMVQQLLAAGADPNMARTSGETPLMTAARVGAVEVVRQLLAQGADISITERSRGQTALMLAVSEGHVGVVRILLENGGGVSTQSHNGFTPLLFAARQGDVAVAQVLLEAGADVNEAAPEGIGGDTNARAYLRPDTEASVLMVAIDSGHLEMALMLLGQGADPNQSGAGRTPLHSAIQQAMPGVVAALIEAGADTNARLERRMPLLSRYIRLSNGLDPSRIGATPFWLAASYGDVATMQVLVDAGASPLLTSDDGTTPLMVAAGADFVEGQDKYGRRWFGDTTSLQLTALEAVTLCLELGNAINARNEDGQTALHGSVYLGGTILAPFLVEQGADINAINHRGQTPWMVAVEGEYRAGSFYTHEETGEVLEALGADMTLGKDLGPDFAQQQQ